MNRKESLSLILTWILYQIYLHLDVSEDMIN